MDKSIAIMQPYFFPYIGYFQLISEADSFVLFDDVNFIKRGWINRNRILVNSQESFLTISCKSASQNKRINEIEHSLTPALIDKLLKKITFSYSKAPFFEPVFQIVQSVLQTEGNMLLDVCINSLKECISYLEINTPLRKSSGFRPGNYQNPSDRLIDITLKDDGNCYLNPIGGLQLYEKKYFSQRGVKLHFIKPELINYTQFKSSFVPNLSIIDVMMFNSIDEIKESIINRYQII